MDSRTEVTEAFENLGVSMMLCGAIVSLFVQKPTILIICYTTVLSGLFVFIFAQAKNKK